MKNFVKGFYYQFVTILGRKLSSWVMPGYSTEMTPTHVSGVFQHHLLLISITWLGWVRELGFQTPLMLKIKKSNSKYQNNIYSKQKQLLKRAQMSTKREKAGGMVRVFVLTLFSLWETKLSSSPVSFLKMCQTIRTSNFLKSFIILC